MTRLVKWAGWLLSAVLTATAAFSAERRPPEVTVLESIDVGDVLVMGNETLDVEMAAGGQRRGSAGASVFGSLPFGSGRLRLVGEPGACVRLSALRFGRRADADRIQVIRVQLRGAAVEGQEEIDLRLDPHGMAIVEVGVRMRLAAIERSSRWRLSLSFEARYSKDCLY